MKKKTERMLVAGRIASHLSNKSNRGYAQKTVLDRLNL